MVSFDAMELIGGTDSWDTSQLKTLSVNPNFGSGYLSEVKVLNSGVSMVLQDFTLHGDGNIRLTKTDSSPSLVGFSTCLSGINQITYAKPRVHLGQGPSFIEIEAYQPALFMDVKSNTPIKVLLVCMDPTVFNELTGKSVNTLIEELDNADSSANRKTAPVTSKRIDFAQQFCASQAVDAFMNTPEDSLLLEAKALEMVALQLKQLDHVLGKTMQKQVADPDTERIPYACEILAKEMANPPGARQLAKRVGLSYSQLINGFKASLGMLPYEYLREIRLEKAYGLITKHECNITEAALNVGYASHSHFTKLFQKKFGVNPKAHALKN